MALLRTLLERLFALIFWLVGTVTTIQGLAILAAVGSAIAIRQGRGAPDWALQPLALGAGVCLALMAGGILLGLLNSRSGLRSAWGRVDESLQPSWLLPAAVPTLVLPAVAFWQSGKLIELWRDALSVVDRFGGASQILKADGGGLILLPAAAVLFVPFLELSAAAFLVAVPPLLLALLASRSRRFRLESTRLVITQWSLVGASVLGSVLFGRLVELATPHIMAAGEREGAMVLAELARGRSVLGGTATAYSALALANALALWVLMNAGPPREWVAIETPEPATAPEPGPDPEPALPPSSSAPSPRESFEETLRRYRARQGRGS